MKKQSVQIRFPIPLHKELKTIADEIGISMNALCVLFAKKGVKQHTKQGQIGL